MAATRNRLAALLAIASISGLPSSSTSPRSTHWVGTWAASPMGAPNRGATFGAGTAGTTLREIVHVSMGGSAVRIVFTNEFGSEPLTIGAAEVALRGAGSSVSGAGTPLLFAGRPTTTLPAGALALSDPVDLEVPSLADLAISFFLPVQTITQITLHPFADQTSYTAPGNLVDAPTLVNATEIPSWDFLKGVDVQADTRTGTIVAFGDSITDGALSTRNANARWPDVLACRLAGDKKAQATAILNEGIGGNRILHPVTGPGALERFDRDVLAQAGVRYLIILEGINDIGHAFDPGKPYDVVSVDDLIAGYIQLAERAHTHGIKVYGATLTPYVGAKYQSPPGERARQALNQWIRATKMLDGVIDFDQVTRDPANPAIFLPAFDSGDHLHPKDAGYRAMGESIDLKLFEK